MNRVLPFVLPILAALALAAPAQAASHSCTRGGATQLAAVGSARVVSVKLKLEMTETRRDRIYGCWAPTGRRFTMFEAHDNGEDLIERDDIQIVDGRYAGVVRDFEGGVSESQTAAIWDLKTRHKKHDSKVCDEQDGPDFSGPDDAVFLPGGGMAYACDQLRIADAKGDRQLEPLGSMVTNVAVAFRSHGFGARLYWFNGATATAKSLAL
jgi:hypothetical protein